MSEGGLASQTFGVVTGGDEQRRGGVDTDPGPGDQLGCGLVDELSEDRVDLADLGFERGRSSGEHPQRNLRE